MNDVFRQEFGKITDQQKAEMNGIKRKAQELWDLIESIVPPDEKSERARLVNSGKTKLEYAIMGIVKGITTEQK